MDYPIRDGEALALLVYRRSGGWARKEDNLLLSSLLLLMTETLCIPLCRKHMGMWEILSSEVVTCIKFQGLLNSCQFHYSNVTIMLLFLS